MIFEVTMQAIKISFFSNYGFHHCLHNLLNCQKRKFYFKMVFGTVISAIKNILFFVIVGPIIAYISHQNYQKRKFYSKMWLLKLPFFGNCGSHCCLYHPSNFLKKEILFRNVVIKNIFFW